MQYLFAYTQCRQSNYDIAWTQLRECFDAESDDLEITDEMLRGFWNSSVSNGEISELPPKNGAECLEQQVTFYLEQNKKDLKTLRKTMLGEVESIYELFLWILSLPLALASYEQIQLSRKKLSPQSDKQPLLSNNHCLQLLEKKLKDEQTPGWEQHSDRLVQWYRELRQSDILNSDQESMESKDEGIEKLEIDTRFIRLVFKSVLWKSNTFQDFFEERNLGWVENRDIVKSLISKTLRTISHDGLDLAPISYQLEDDQKFFQEIFDITVQKENWTEKLIAEHAKNWEMDRIAQVDMVLLKMAICEMINFPSIPVKVTINEYIEMSKRYSTPKSKKFINGILDVLANELRENGTIVKSGRGLIDNK